MILAQIIAAAAETAAETDNMIPGEWASGLVTASIGARIGAVGRGAVQKREIGPQPFDVREHREPTWAEVSELSRRMECAETEMRRIRNDMLEQYKEITNSAEARANRLMKALGESIGKVHGRLDDMTKALGRLEGRSMRD